MPRKDAPPDPFAPQGAPRAPLRTLTAPGTLGVGSLRVHPGPTQIGVLGIEIEPVSTPPTNPVEGTLSYDLTGHQLQFWNGTAWIGISASSVGVSSVTGTVNQITASPTTGAVLLSLPSSGTLPGSWTAATGFTVNGTLGGTFVLARARIPAEIAYEDEANTFTLGQTFNGNNIFSGLDRFTETRWFEAGAAADEKLWAASNGGIVSGDFSLFTRSDAGTFGQEAYRIVRTGTSVSSFQFTNGVVIVGSDPSGTAKLRGTGGLTYQAVSGTEHILFDLSVSNEFRITGGDLSTIRFAVDTNGLVRIGAGVTNPANTAFVYSPHTTVYPLRVKGRVYSEQDTVGIGAGFAWRDTTSSADNKMWDAIAASTELLFRGLSDDESSNAIWLRVTRSGVGFSNARFQTNVVIPNSGQGSLWGRNAADNANLNLFGLDSADNLNIGRDDSIGQIQFFGPMEWFDDAATPSSLGSLNSGHLSITGEYRINGVPRVAHSASYTILVDPSHHIAAFLGGTGDPANYFDNTTHYVRSRDALTLFTQTNATSFRPGTASSLTLGESSFPWSNFYLGQSNFIQFGATANGPLVQGNVFDDLILRAAGNLVFLIGATTELRLSGTGLFPDTAGGLSLGFAAQPWSNIFTRSLEIRDSGGALVAGFDNSLADTLRIFNSGGTYRYRMRSSDFTPETTGLVTLGSSGLRWGKFWGGEADLSGDLKIASLGVFDSTDTPTDLQLLVYHAGSINKWQAESIQFIYNAGDAAVALLADNTATAFVYLDPGAGADSPVGAPPAPVIKVFRQHKGATVQVLASTAPDVEYHDGPSFPADFRHFIYEYSLDAFGTAGVALATASSDKVVHSRLAVGTTYSYRVRAVDRAGNASANSAVVSIVANADSQASAFGILLASEIAVDRLAALSANIGIITAGQVRNAANDGGFNLGGVGGIPSGWKRLINLEDTTLPTYTASEGRAYINLFDGTGDLDYFLRHDRLEVKFDGSVRMYQTSSQPMFKLDSSDFLLQNDNASPTQGLLVDGSLPGGWTRYFNLNGSGTMVKHEKFEIRYDGSMWMNKIIIFLTGGTSWSVPADFNPFLNSVELIGGGGGGAGGVTNTRGGGGGGAGGHSRLLHFNPGSASSITYAIGAAGTPGASGGGAGGNGGQTSWNSGTVTANGGNGATTDPGGAGGSGNVFNGANGGAASVGTSTRGGGGGGGAGGPNSMGTVGAAASVGTGGAGGAGGGPNGGTGGAAGAAGGNGTAWDDNPGSAQAGAGGGGGGGSGVGGGNGGNYGAGGGGGGSQTGSSASGGSGGAGVIVITYFPIGTI